MTHHWLFLLVILMILASFFIGFTSGFGIATLIYGQRGKDDHRNDTNLVL